MPNIYEPDFDEPRDHDGFRARRARLGHQLATEQGSRRLDRGEGVRFPIGEDGAHQLSNDAEDLVRLVSVSTHGMPDVVIYPDSDKLSAAERLATSDGRKHFFRIEDEVDYWDGEG